MTGKSRVSCDDGKTLAREMRGKPLLSEEEEEYLHVAWSTMWSTGCQK